MQSDYPRKPLSMLSWVHIPLAKTVVALAPAVVVTGALLTSNPDALIASRFETALAGTQLARPAEAQTADANISGSEDFWLTRARDANAVMPVAWSAPVAAGDHVAVHHGDLRRIYQVISVEAAGNDTTRIDADMNAPRQYVVAARDTAQSGGKLIRFLLDTGSKNVSIVPPSPRDL